MRRFIFGELIRFISATIPPEEITIHIHDYTGCGVYTVDFTKYCVPSAAIFFRTKITHHVDRATLYIGI